MKKMILPLLAVALGIGFSAFNAKTNTLRSGQHWYKFNGTVYNLTNLQDASLYGDPTELPPCNSDGEICGVLYDEDASDPSMPATFDASFKQRISDVFDESVASDEAISEQQ